MTAEKKNKSKLYIVDEDILPEAIWKTANAKELLAKNKNLTVNEAVEQVGLSRSAFYKYREGVSPFYEASRAKIITVQIHMNNIAGILSACMNEIAKAKGNILTINQGIPINDIAISTIAFDTMEITESLEDVLEIIQQIEGVYSIEVIGRN